MKRREPSLPRHQSSSPCPTSDMRLGCLLVVLSLQLAQSLFQPAIARSCSQFSARPLAVRSRMIFNLAGDEVNGYRELGLSEDATYDKVMDAFMELSEQYRDDPERILVSPRPCTHIATSSPPSPEGHSP